MEISKSEFQQWKDSLITNEVFGEVRNRIREAREDLGVNAGIDPERDRYICGMIKAWEEILDISYEGESNA